MYFLSQKEADNIFYMVIKAMSIRTQLNHILLRRMFIFVYCWIFN